MNLLLISIDSLRFDYVSRTNAAVATPRFDALTEHFNFYPHCFSVSSATRPVHTSVFTGLYPFEHGVLGQNYARMRPGLPHLFNLFRQKNYAVGAFSEADIVFEGLDYAPYIQPLPVYAPESRQIVQRFLFDHRGQAQCLFLHYWCAHTPYGAADNQAYGETARLLFGDGRSEVLGRYRRAVIDLFEFKLAPLFEILDLSTWCVVLFGDHGESWTEEEPYHGQTLRNAVLRVPLYLHVPHTGNPALAQSVLSLIDLFPTLVSLFGLPVNYRGFGSDLFSDRCNLPYLAQIHALPLRDDLNALGAPATGGLKWALFDAVEKFTYDEALQQGKLEHTLSEEPTENEGDQTRFLNSYAQLQKRSHYTLGWAAAVDGPGDDILLNKRLEQLGYL